MPARGLTTLQTVIQGLTGGASNAHVLGTGKSAPYGIEAILEYNGIYLNVREWADTFLVKTINGIDDADIRDSRAPNPGDDGETAFNSYYGGRTLVISGKVLAGTVDRLRDMNQGVRGAFAEINTEYPLIFHGRDPERSIYINCRKNTPLQLPEEQTTPNDFMRPFNITLRASNPRFLSVVKLKNTITSVASYIDFETVTTPVYEDFRSLLLPSGLSAGYDEIGGAFSATGEYLMPAALRRNLLAVSNGIDNNGPSTAGWGVTSANAGTELKPISDLGLAGGGWRAAVRPVTSSGVSNPMSWYPLYTFNSSINGPVVPGRWYGFRARMRISNYEMIENPGFETDLAGWNTASWAGPVKQRTTNWAYISPNVASLYLVSGALGPAGQNSIEYNGGVHVSTGGSDPNFGRMIIAPGGKYEMRASIKCINRQQTATGYLQVDFYDAAGAYITSGVSTPAVQAVGIVDETKWLGWAPANAVAAVPRIVINGGASGGLMEMYVDDVLFHPVGFQGNGASTNGFVLYTRWLDRLGSYFASGETNVNTTTGISAPVGSYLPGDVIDLYGVAQAPAGAASAGMEIVLVGNAAIHGQINLGMLMITPVDGPESTVPEWGDWTRPGWEPEGYNAMSPSRQIFPVANWIQNPIAIVDTFGISAPAGTVTRLTAQSNAFTGGTTAFRRTEPNAGVSSTYVDIANNNFGDSYTIYAEANKDYVFSFYGKTATTIQTPRQIRISVYWYNAAKKLINWSDTYAYEMTDWRRFVAGGRSPVGTAYVQIRIYWQPADATPMAANEAHDFGWLMWHEGTTPKVFATAGGVYGDEPRYIPAWNGLLGRSETLGPIAQMNYSIDPDVNDTNTISDYWDFSRLQNATVKKIAKGGPIDGGRYAELTYIGGVHPNFGFVTEAPYGLAAGQGYWSAGAYMRVPEGKLPMRMVIECDWFDMNGQIIKFDSTQEFEVNDQWGWYTYEGLQAPPSAASVRFYFINLAPASGDVLHVDKILCTDSQKAGEFFDGTSDWGEWQYPSSTPDRDASRRFMYSLWKTQRSYLDAQQTLKLTMPRWPPLVTNYITNPSFEVDTSSWVTYIAAVGTASITRQAGGRTGSLGGWSARAARLTGGPANMGVQIVNPVPQLDLLPGKTWIWSAWVRGPAGRTGQCYMDWGRSGVAEFKAAQFAFTGGWQRVSVTATIPPGNITGSNVYVWLEGAANGEGFDIDDAMFTQGTYLYDYADGSYPGYAWNGTANLSTATQIAKLDKVYDEVHLVLAWVNTDNQIYAALTKQGKLGLYKRQDGILTTLVESPTAMTLMAFGTYWIRARMAQGVVLVEWHTSSPTGTGAFGGTNVVPLYSGKYTLTTNERIFFEDTRHPMALGVQTRGARWKLDDWRYVEINEPRGWNFYQGAGTVYVNGGKLMPFDMTPKMMTRSGLTYKVADGVLTAKIVRTENPPDGQDWSMGIVAKVIDKDNYLFVRLNHHQIPSGQAGYQYGYQFGACVGGVENQWSISEATIPLNTPMWLRMRTVGDVVTMEKWLTDPTLGGAASTVWTVTLGDAMSGSTATEKTLFGAGKKGEFGVKMWSPNPLTQGIDDFRLDLPTFDDIAFTVNNEGNYPAQTRIELTGPMSNPRITNETNGKSMLINTAIPAGETWVIEQNGSSKLVYRKSDSANRMQYFDDTSEWITIDPDGVPNNIRLTATGLTLGWDMDLTFQHTWM